MSGRERARRLGLRAAGRALAARERRGEPSRARLERLLLVRPDHLGDLLWLTPALRRLRAAWPEAEIWVACGPWGAPVLAGNRDLDALLPVAFPGFTRRPKGGPLAPYRYLRRQARLLRRHDFDAAAILRNDHWWGALLAAAAGIPRRFGYAHPDVAPFLTDTLPPPPREHAAVTNARLLDALTEAGERRPPARPLDPCADPSNFRPSPADAARAAELLAETGADDGAPLVAIHPSAGVPVKLWDEGRLATVADRLAADYGAQIVLTGGPGDEALTAAVARQMTTPALDLAGRTSLGELGAVFARCALALGPDSGALHLAVAAGAPTVHLYGPADPVKFGPWGAPARQRVVSAGMHCARCGDLLPARPRGAACMLAIEVADVLRAARPLLGERVGR